MIRDLICSGASISEVAEYLSVPASEVYAAMAFGIPLLKVKRINKTALIPRYSTSGSAAFDLHATHMGDLMSGESGTVCTGIAVEIPAGMAGLILPRSGLAAKRGITVLNAPGLIDSDYRGEIMVILHNTGASTFRWQAGDRIAQMMLLGVAMTKIIEVDKLSDTERGAGGLGSTGVSA